MKTKVSRGKEIIKVIAEIHREQENDKMIFFQKTEEIIATNSVYSNITFMPKSDKCLTTKQNYRHKSLMGLDGNSLIKSHQIKSIII